MRWAHHEGHAPNMALQRTRRPRFRSDRSLRSPLNARPLGGHLTTATARFVAVAVAVLELACGRSRGTSNSAAQRTPTPVVSADTGCRLEFSWVSVVGGPQRPKPGSSSLVIPPNATTAACSVVSSESSPELSLAATTSPEGRIRSLYLLKPSESGIPAGYLEHVVSCLATVNFGRPPTQAQENWLNIAVRCVPIR